MPENAASCGRAGKGNGSRRLDGEAGVNRSRRTQSPEMESIRTTTGRLAGESAARHRHNKEAASTQAYPRRLRRARLEAHLRSHVDDAH